VYILKITGLEEQKDIQSLERTLFRLPGLSLETVSRGLKYPPFKVLTTENEGQVQSIKNILEKYGAICEVENADKRRKYEVNVVIPPRKKRKIEWQFWVIIFGILGFFVAIAIYFSGDSDNTPKNQNTQATQAPRHAANNAAGGVGGIGGIDVMDDEADERSNDEKSTEDLRKDLVKNSFNADAWRALSEKLDGEGNEAAARTAKENYERAIKAQMVLSSLAKAFGNNVRVEITENAVYYRTHQDFTDAEFHQEASRLRDSLSVTFPGKRNLIIENYTSKNTVQRISLAP
jgi:hypothetical protein